MKIEVSEKLDNWAKNNNWSSSHPQDGERFWDFVIEAFKRGDHAIAEEDFYRALVGYYNDEDVLTDMYIKYENGVELLRQFTKMNV